MLLLLKSKICTEGMFWGESASMRLGRIETGFLRCFELLWDIADMRNESACSASEGDILILLL